MIQGPRDIFHGLSCLLASLSGGQSRSLALLQGKLAEANVPFQQIPRFIEISEDLVRSPDSIEPVKAISPTELSYELEYHQTMADASTFRLDVPRPQDANQSSHNLLGGTQNSFPFVVEAGMLNEVDSRPFNTPGLGDSATHWNLHMTQV